MEVNIIILSTQSKKKDVLGFLKELKTLLQTEEFDSAKNLVLVKKRKACPDQCYSTPYTLVDLDYDEDDVIERLKELSVAEYSETKIDRDDLNPPLLFVFGKKINGKLVYIKLKIRDDENTVILCVSFHYAKEKMKFPYAK